MAKEDELIEKVYSAFLTEEEKLKIQKDVEKELDAENKKKVAKDYKDSLISAAKKKALFKDAKQGENAEGLVPVFIDLPAVTECIRLDGTAFYPGKTYNVLPAVRDVINEIMHRGREHEDSLNGKKAKENLFRRQNPNRIQQ